MLKWEQIILNHETLSQIIEKNKPLSLNKTITTTVHHSITHQIMVKISTIKVNKKIHGWEVRRDEVFMDKNTINIKSKNWFKDLHTQLLRTSEENEKIFH